ncbi:mRNA cap guanine-N7 methyltransferase-like [Argonauta hians]
MESENTCDKSFKEDAENDVIDLAEDESPEETPAADQGESEQPSEDKAEETAAAAAADDDSGKTKEEEGADKAEDKEKPESAATGAEGDGKDKKDGSKISKTVAEHYNELPESGLEARSNSRIFYLRNFNNWIKSVLIGDTLQKIRKERSGSHKHVVLDLCSGKGGDLLKWKKGRINQLVCVDIAKTSVEQSESRFKDIVERNRNNKRREQLFDAEFITADVTRQRLKDLYKDSSISFDLVSCQFALHYSFESYSQADMMLKNAAECLQDGGYFIGTTTNSYELVNRLRKSDSTSFGNDVYKVEFQCEDKDNLPLFGAQYSFQLEGVVDCPEFLVYFPALEKLAEKYHLKLKSKKPFLQFFEENYNTSENRSLLGRMQALEPYPAEKEGKLISSSVEDYSHAKEALDKALSSQPSSRPFKAGTLTESEWKAINLYQVFVFQKVEPKAEGAEKEGEASKEAEEAEKRPHADDADDDNNNKDDEEDSGPTDAKVTKEGEEGEEEVVEEEE